MSPSGLQAEDSLSVLSSLSFLQPDWSALPSQHRGPGQRSDFCLTMTSSLLLVLDSNRTVSQFISYNTQFSVLILCFLTATKSSLDALRKRLYVLKYQQSSSSYSGPSPPPPLFRASIQLAIPNIVLRPSLDDIQVFLVSLRTLLSSSYSDVYLNTYCVFQSTVNKLVNVVLSVTKDIPLWTYSHLQYRQQQVLSSVVSLLL